MARHAITEGEVRTAIERLDPVWNGLFPGEQAPIVQVLVERIDVDQRGLELRLRAEGLVLSGFQMDAELKS
jgi:site-specific DNA recombinase